jgi:hypothetical protein
MLSIIVEGASVAVLYYSHDTLIVCNWVVIPIMSWLLPYSGDRAHYIVRIIVRIIVRAWTFKVISQSLPLDGCCMWSVTASQTAYWRVSVIIKDSDGMVCMIVADSGELVGL